MLKTSSTKKRKVLWNVIAISYILGGYVYGLIFLLSANILLNLLGTFLLTHSLVLSAYLFHEFMHGTIFTRAQWNIVGGNIMLWLNGGCYARFKDLAREHIFHHVNKIDSVVFNLPDFMITLPLPLRSLIVLLEWFYFPIISFVFQFFAITAPFWNNQRQDERLRVTLLFLVRGFLFTLLTLISLKALFLYFLAYTGMITVLRLMDAFQHTYEVFPVGASLPDRDHFYERNNTFTTLFSQRYWWLNLLVLNFGYHNAHHSVIKCPWYNLHELDRDLYNDARSNYITLRQLLRNYHRYRVTRIFSNQRQEIDEQRKLNLDTFYGAVGLSFLVKS